MKKFTLALILAPATLIALVACGSDGTEPQTEPFPPPIGTTTSTTAPLPPRATDVVVGQPNTLTLSNGIEIGVTFDALTPMAGSQCTGVVYDGGPDKQFLRVDYTVRSGDTVPDDYTSIFGSFLWKVRGDDGIVIDEAGMDEDAGYCIDSDEKGAEFYTWETNSIYTASIVLPRQGESGTVILEPSDYVTEDRFELRYGGPAAPDVIYGPIDCETASQEVWMEHCR